MKNVWYLTYSPDVHRRPILSVAHQELGSPVPPGGDVVRVVLPGTDHPGKPEVAELHHSVLGMRRSDLTVISQWSLTLVMRMFSGLTSLWRQLWRWQKLTACRVCQTMLCTADIYQSETADLRLAASYNSDWQFGQGLTLVRAMGTPLGYFSSSLRTVWSQNSKTRCSLRFLRKTSIRLTRFGCLRFFSIRISLRAIFLMRGSSSLSTNFLMATRCPVSLARHL